MKFEQKVTGHKRKVIATVIAEALSVPARYAGIPSFAYKAGGWTVDKDNNLKSPVGDLQTLTTVFAA